MLIEVLRVTLLMVAVKAMVIGSEFNFQCLIKHGRRYWGWYKNRETFKEFLARH